MGPETGLDVVKDRKIPATSENRTLTIQSLARHYTELSRLVVKYQVR